MDVDAGPGSGGWFLGQGDKRMHLVSVMSGADGVLIVSLRGEIDFTNSAAAYDSVSAAVQREHPSSVSVDLDEVSFLDSSGIGLLVRIMRLAEEAGADYRVCNPRPRVRDQLRLSGLLEVFRVPPPAPEADRPVR